MASPSIKALSQTAISAIIAALVTAIMAVVRSSERKNTAPRIIQLSATTDQIPPSINFFVRTLNHRHGISPAK